MLTIKVSSIMTRSPFPFQTSSIYLQMCATLKTADLEFYSMDILMGIKDKALKKRLPKSIGCARAMIQKQRSDAAPVL